MLNAVVGYGSQPSVVGAAGHHGLFGSTATTIFLGILITVAAAAIVGIWNYIAARGTRRQERQTAEQIANLEAMVRRLQEESDAKRPKPTVSFVSTEGPAEAVLFERTRPPEIDVEEIVASERRAALATLPLVPGTPEAEEAERRIEKAAADAGIAVPPILKALTNPKLERQLGLAGFGHSRLLPVTKDDHAAFQKVVDEYEAKLRRFIPAWIEYLGRIRSVVVLKALVGNDGGAPADGASVRLTFPDPCVRGQIPKRPGEPARPTFEQRRTTAYSAVERLLGFDNDRLTRTLLTTPAIRTPSITAPNLTGPFYDDGSVIVRFEYRSLQHHDPFETDSFVLAIPEPAVYDVDWVVHAKNLPRPATGTLSVEFREHDPPVETVTTFEALLALGPSVEDDDALD